MTWRIDVLSKEGQLGQVTLLKELSPGPFVCLWLTFDSINFENLNGQHMECHVYAVTSNWVTYKPASTFTIKQEKHIWRRKEAEDKQVIESKDNTFCQKLIK